MRPSLWASALRLAAGALLTLAPLAMAACHGARVPQVASAAIKPPANTSPDEPTKAFPPDFDARFPVFPGSSVDHVRRPKGAMREILFSADAPVDKLIGFYEQGLKKGGYQITSALKMEARRTWSCDFHKRGQQASVMLFPSDDDKSRITVDLIYEMPSRETQRPEVQDEQFDIVGPGEVAQQTSAQNQKRN